jgi:hypothetical protein
MTPTAVAASTATRTQLVQRLELVYRWYEGMVNAKTGMFEYLYVPETDAFIRRKSPIRDLGSVWDAEVLGDFLGRDTLRPLIDKSLRHYARYLVDRDGLAILDSSRLEAFVDCAQRFHDSGAAPRPGPTRLRKDRRARRGHTPAAASQWFVQGAL